MSKFVFDRNLFKVPFGLVSRINASGDSEVLAAANDLETLCLTVDRMFEDNTCNNNQLIYDYLSKWESKYSDDANFLWRQAKACHCLAKSDSYQDDADARKEILYNAFAIASRALELDPSNADCHKWYGENPKSCMEPVKLFL